MVPCICRYLPVELTPILILYYRFVKTINVTAGPLLTLDEGHEVHCSFGEEYLQ